MVSISLQEAAKGLQEAEESWEKTNPVAHDSCSKQLYMSFLVIKMVFWTCWENHILWGGGFKYVLFSPLLWGNDPSLLIFVKCVEITN